MHAGVDEEAGDLWRLGTEDDAFCLKYPPTLGAFYKDVVAGHVGVSGTALADDPAFDEVFWDGQSHYYLDASTERTGVMYLLRYDTERRRYHQRRVTAEDVGPLMPVEAFDLGAS